MAKKRETPTFGNKSQQAREQALARKKAQAERGSSKFGASNPHNGAAVSQSGKKSVRGRNGG
ncbi:MULTISPECIES: hypothetical protein [unclassified Rathayibacter]|uniref:hypothetical protein n=1 Tax=unclassified Rathayibacter TaxID=2609250 RepID=UPI0011B0F160|nr:MULTISPECIES: hypothetical protein [unclassified Rathayibacter]